MTVTAPPRPPRRGEPLEREEIEALVEALIEEARQRAQRRRRRNGAVVTLVALVGVALFAALGRSAQSQTASPALSARSSLAAQAAGSKIAFISEPPGGGYCGSVHVMNADGSGRHRPTPGGADECAQEGGHAWSPDGRRIAIVASRDGNADIYVMNADGSGQRNLTRGAGFEGSPAWSPDGRRIAFAGGGASNVDIYVMNADGSGQRRLTRGAAPSYSDPVWSPDGRRIAFVGGGASNSDIYVMNADGSGQRRLTRKGARNFAPAWSPDGQRIAFERGRRHRTPCSWCPGLWGYDVYVMNADGSGQQRLTRGASQPRWSPDGRKIAFVSQRDGSADIYVMNADGSGPRNLTRTPRHAESQPLWSPAQK